MKNDGVQIPYQGGVRNRRQRTLERLQTQLKTGLKQPRGTVMALDRVPLTDSDKKRIEKEIEILKSKL